MRRISLLLSVLLLASANSFADSIFLVTDARSVEGRVSAYTGIPNPPSIYWDQNFTSSAPAFSASTQQPQLPGAFYGSYSAAQVSNVSETELKGRMSFAVSAGFVAGYTLRSTYDITFYLASVTDFDLKSTLQLAGTHSFGPSATLTLSLTGPSGDVFRYNGDPYFPPEQTFNLAGSLVPGEYRLFAEAYLTGSVYKSEYDNRNGFVDFTMELAPTAVPEGRFPVWLYGVVLVVTEIGRRRSRSPARQV